MCYYVMHGMERIFCTLIFSPQMKPHHSPPCWRQMSFACVIITRYYVDQWFTEVTFSKSIVWNAQQDKETMAEPVNQEYNHDIMITGFPDYQQEALVRCYKLSVTLCYCDMGLRGFFFHFFDFQEAPSESGSPNLDSSQGQSVRLVVHELTEIWCYCIIKLAEEMLKIFQSIMEKRAEKILEIASQN